jgi:hypothetical protein
MEVSGRLRPSYFERHELPVPTTYMTGWQPEPVWTVWRILESLFLLKIETKLFICPTANLHNISRSKRLSPRYSGGGNQAHPNLAIRFMVWAARFRIDQVCYDVKRQNLILKKNVKSTYTGGVRLEVFTAVTMTNGVFWDVTPCGSCKNRRFGGT